MNFTYFVCILELGPVDLKDPRILRLQGKLSEPYLWALGPILFILRVINLTSLLRVRAQSILLDLPRVSFSYLVDNIFYQSGDVK